jgi:2Fe-2S ferredoxin
MAKITYIEPSGTEAVVDVPGGWTLMQGATANGIDGIEAECGGSCACATCHCYVDGAQASRLAPPAATELAMLENVAAERLSNSRLSCQIKVSAELDGLLVRLPERQS